jgi:hypothetical protein
MKWNRCVATIGMAILPVRSALPYLLKAQLFEKSSNLFCF